MSESTANKSNRPLHIYEYPSLIMPIRFRKRFHLLYLLVSLNIIFFLIVYHRLVLITPSKFSSNNLSIRSVIEDNLNTQNDQYSSSSSSSSICYIPRFDPWDQTVAKSIRIKPVYRCPMNKQNLINVINNTQLYINQTVNIIYYSKSVTHCVYLKVDRNPEEKYFRDWSYTLSEPILIGNGYTKPILDADFVVTRCYNDRKAHFDGTTFW
jgi:hypothetical protein